LLISFSFCFLAAKLYSRHIKYNREEYFVKIISATVDRGVRIHYSGRKNLLTKRAIQFGTGSIGRGLSHLNKEKFKGATQ